MNTNHESPVNCGAARMPLTPCRLGVENRVFDGSGGVSRHNRGHGFVPAFFDHATGYLYRSRFDGGQPAPFHLLDGLPAHLLCRSPQTGEITSTVPGVESGFARNGRFYSRAEAAAAVRAASTGGPA
ncbi:MAG: hypothetical protein QNJ91_10145 [Gammaproteobacteria bacterium]|nr:hypothetical protein [Gammaproteobacteria bacterium]